jgi:nucleotide-binding universal stress UspA family protein
MIEHKPFRPKRILCPMDFSELSDLALKYAAMGAREFDAELALLHAHFFELPKYFVPDNADSITNSLKRAKKDIRNSLEQHAKKILGPMYDEITLDFDVIDQHPAGAIMAAVKEKACDIIVMGTHGLSGIKRFLMGSITERVVRESPVPVFTIRQKVHDFIEVQNTEIIPKLKRVVCPCDLKPTSRPAFEVAVSLADCFKAELTVLHIQEEGKAKAVDEIQEQINAILGDIHRQPCPVEIKVRQGNSAEEIVKQVIEYQEDIVVLGAVHKSFLEDSFLGRTTELVMRHAPVPIFITPIYQGTNP